MIEKPHYFPLYIRLKITLQPHTLVNEVHQSLLQAFSTGELADGQPAFFAAGQFTFAQPLYQGQILAAAVQVKGVSDAQITDFRPFNRPKSTQLPPFIQPSEFGIIEVQNNPAHPERGLIEFDIPCTG
ncbi:MAG: hypothetical protein AAF702_15915 [Chloroflexota bacterium]